MYEEDVIVQAGWYPDPMGLPQLRWWNNHAWTELTTEAQPPLVMQEPAHEPEQKPPRLLYADDELPTRRQQREQREREEEYVRLATDEKAERDAAAAYSPLTSTLREIDPPAVSASNRSVETSWPVFEKPVFEKDDGSLSSGPEQQPSRAHSLPRLPTYTGPVWMIALLPLVQLVVGLLILLGIGAVLSASFTVVVLVAPYLIVIVLAIADRALLRRAGHERTAHWVWALLSAPVYLLVRAIALGRTGEIRLAPLLVWVALGLLEIGAVLVVPGMLISVVPTAFSAQAQHSVQSEAGILGTAVTVSCPQTPPLLIGQRFTCSALSADGSAHNVSVSLQRANGWIDWRVDDWGTLRLNR